MKKAIFTLLISVLAAASAMAQDKGGIAISKLAVARNGDDTEISFTAEIGRKAATAGTTVVYAPFITDGEHKVSLFPIIVQGRRAEVSWDRHAWAGATEPSHPAGIYARNGGTIEYTATVPFQHWMYDSRIEAETITAGCCSVQRERSTLTAAILPAPPAVIVEPEPAPPVLTVAEQLAETFPFVLPASEFDPEKPFNMPDGERHGNMTVYYHLSSYDIDLDYADNRQTLINLLAAIDIIRNSPDSEVSRIVIAGFSSPEGKAEANDRLAWERAVSVKEYITKNTGLEDGAITLFNGSSDWHGLRLLVDADKNVPGRQRVLDIIDNQPVWNAATQTGRLTSIRALNGGETYRYLVRNIFPKLRNGTFIRIYFDNK